MYYYYYYIDNSRYSKTTPTHSTHTHTQKQKCFVSLLNEQQTDRSVIINRGNHLEQIGTILCYNIILQEDKYVCGFIIYIYICALVYKHYDRDRELMSNV